MLNVSGVRTLIKTLGNFVDTISKMANLSIADQWDEHGKPIHFRKIEDKEFI